MNGQQFMYDDAKQLANLMVSNPAIKKIGTDTVGFASGTLGVRKILLTGEMLEDLGFTPYPGLEALAGKADDAAVARVLTGFHPES